jgi:hypothetical protein
MICSLLFLITSCDKNDNSKPIEGDVALFLLNTYETSVGSCQIIDSTAITKEIPLIAYSDFISYNPDNYLFRITEKTKGILDTIEFPVTGTAFAIKANNQTIYTGYFWPVYSSVGCNWITIDPIMIDFRNGLKVELGYPGQIEGQEISDKRNDKRILDIFKRDGKLED